MLSEKTERNRLLIEMREYSTLKELSEFFGISAGRVSAILRKSRLPKYYCKQCDAPISYLREHRGNKDYGRGLCIQCIVWNRGVIMPELGEIRHSRDLNLPGSYYWKWWQCELCGKQEWKRTPKTPNTSRAQTKICKPCNIAVQKRGFNYSVHMKGNNARQN